MLPSTLPVDKIEGCFGCHVRVDISFWWPRSKQTSRIIRRSNIRAVWSRAQVANSWPLVGSKLVFETVFLCPWRVVRHWPVRGSHNFTLWSLDPETRRPFVGCQSTVLASQLWPLRTDSSTPSAKSKIFNIESSLAVTNLVSPGEKARSRMGVSSWAWIALTQLKLICQYCTTPVWSADISQSSLCEKTAARIAESCAWKMPWAFAEGCLS